MSAAPALIAAAAGVAVGHAILPDHWVPLAVLGRSRGYPLRQVTRLATLAGIAHVFTSLLAGTVLVVVGLQFRSVVEGAENLVVGGALIATGLVFVLLELTGHRHRGDHEAPRGHSTGRGSDGGRQTEEVRHSQPSRSRVRRNPRLHGAAAVMVPFGAAASPDLTILPVFLAATAAGVLASVGTLLAFSLVTIATIVSLTISASIGGHRVRGELLDRWGNAGTAAVLLTVGGLVLTGVV